MDLGHWEFMQEFDINDWFGFIYRIVELNTGREYIGKKQFFANRTKVVKGRKNRKHYKKESNWKIYTSSCVELNNSISTNGKSNYKFQIESLHKTKGSLHYAEVSMQIYEDVLRIRLPDGTKKYYNGQIPGVKFIPPTQHSEETKIKIKNKLLKLYEDKSNHWFHKLSDEEKEDFLNSYLRGDNRPVKRNKLEEEYQKWLDENLRGSNNPMYGQDPHNKGKTFEELYGRETAEEMKEILRIKCPRQGEENGFYGKHHTQETKDKIRSANIRLHSGEKNPMFGKPCFYNMTDNEIQQWKNNISKASKGKNKSKEHKDKIGAAHKGKKKPMVTCPHCGKTGGINNMKRYHFDNCKLIKNYDAGS